MPTSYGSQRRSGSQQTAPPDFGTQVLKKLIDYEADYRFQQKVEAEAMGVPPEITMQQLLHMYSPQSVAGMSQKSVGFEGQPAQGQPPTQGQPQQPQAQPMAQPPQPMQAGQPAKPGMLNRAMAGVKNFIRQPGQFDPNTGAYQDPSLLGGLIHEDPQNRLARIQGNAAIQKMQGKEPVQEVDIFKEQEAYRREELKQMHDLDKQGRLTAQNLFESFNKASQPFVVVRDAYQRIEASAEDPSPAGDLALIYGFMKILDPGSTVREGEAATAQNAANVPERVRAQYNATINGQKLSSKTRADFLDRSRRLFKGAERQFSKGVREYVSLARRNGINPETFMTDQGLAQASGSSRQLTDDQAQKMGAVAYDTDKGVYLDANGREVR